MSTIAIVLPLYGRSDFTIRFLDFYNRKNCKFSFYIPDGSKKKIFNQKILERKFKNLKIIYKSYPYDNNIFMYIKKLSSISEIINEKYLMLIANDDFFNLKFIAESKKFLDKNKEFVSVAGFVKNIRVILPFKSINDHGHVIIQKSFQYQSYGQIFNDVNSDDKDERIKNYIMSLTYESLIRTSVFKKIFSLAKEFKVKNSFEMNWFMNFIVLTSGKKKHMKLISQIRQSNTYRGLGQDDMLYGKGATKSRFLKFLKMLERKKILTSKNSRSLKNMDNDLLNIWDKERKKPTIKKKLIIKYVFWRDLIKNMNYIFYFFWLLFTKDKYHRLFKKINNIFKYYNSKNDIFKTF